MSKRRIFASRSDWTRHSRTRDLCSVILGLDTNGTATLVVSGGSTPKGLFAALSAADLDWKNITVLLADERWVDESHGDSNTAMVGLLLTGAAADANWIDFGAGSTDVELELDRVKRLKCLRLGQRYRDFRYG